MWVAMGDPLCLNLPYIYFTNLILICIFLCKIFDIFLFDVVFCYKQSFDNQGVSGPFQLNQSTTPCSPYINYPIPKTKFKISIWVKINFTPSFLSLNLCVIIHFLEEKNIKLFYFDTVRQILSKKKFLCQDLL